MTNNSCRMANSSCPPCTPLIQDPPSTGEDPTVLGPCSQNRPHNNFPHFSMLISSHREVQLLKMLINCNSLHPLHNHGGKEGAKNLSQIFLVRPQKWTPISPPKSSPRHEVASRKGCSNSGALAPSLVDFREQNLLVGWGGGGGLYHLYIL